MIHTQLLFKIAACLYFLSFVSAFLSDRRRSVIYLFLCPALMANAVVVLLRYQQAWPMLPMYLGPVALPLCLGLLVWMIPLGDVEGLRVRRIVLAQTLIVSLAAVLFPKDYYLPLVKSLTIWAHLFFFLGVAGKGCFLVSAAWAMAALRTGMLKKASEPHTEHRIQNAHSKRIHGWTVWGFAFWTLSMFTGEIWSYRGWGTPVVWEDPAITTAMATWFFYICLLHLHLTGAWTARNRGRYAATGALVIFLLNCLPDLGPFRWPV